jgi:hypothetical protein
MLLLVLHDHTCCFLQLINQPAVLLQGPIPYITWSPPGAIVDGGKARQKASRAAANASSPRGPGGSAPVGDAADAADAGGMSNLALVNGVLRLPGNRYR